MIVDDPWKKEGKEIEWNLRVRKRMHLDMFGFEKNTKGGCNTI